MSQLRCTAIRVLALAALAAACGNGDRVRDALAQVERGEPPETGASAAAPWLPSPTGPCPEFHSGVLRFNPAGQPPRSVLVWINGMADERDGALVLYWHGTSSIPLEAAVGLGPDGIHAIVQEGGIVAAPFADPGAGTYPWFLTAVGAGAGREDDLRLADEIVACAHQQKGIDPRRIHSVGMSAGGLQTTALAYRRSSYVASVVTYSGGIIEELGLPEMERRENPLAALIFHGGAGDFVVVSFQRTSERFWKDLTDRGHFAVICNHGRDHTIPLEARGFTWAFLKAHPYGTAPSPWAGGLPPHAPAFCTLSP